MHSRLGCSVYICNSRIRKTSYYVCIIIFWVFFLYDLISIMRWLSILLFYPLYSDLHQNWINFFHYLSYWNLFDLLKVWLRAVFRFFMQLCKYIHFPQQLLWRIDKCRSVSATNYKSSRHESHRRRHKALCNTKWSIIHCETLY